MDETRVMNQDDEKRELGFSSKSIIIEILTLGTGTGITGVYSEEPCSSVVLLINNQPKLLIDIGFGVTKEYYRQFNNKNSEIPNIYITKSSSPQTAELPIVIRRENYKRTKKNSEPLNIFAHENIIKKLKLQLEDEEFHDISFHCVPELSSPLSSSHLPTSQQLNANDLINIDNDVSFNCLPDDHGCYSLLLYYQRKPLLSYSGEFQYSSAIFNRLSHFPTVILSARKKVKSNNAKFCSFEEIEKLIVRENAMNSNFFITSYGEQNIKDDPSPPLVPLRPGRKYSLPLPREFINENINIANSLGYTRCNTTAGILSELRRWNEENSLILFIGDELSGMGWTADGKLASPSVSNLIKEIFDETKNKLLQYDLPLTSLFSSFSPNIVFPQNFKLKHLRSLHEYLNDDKIRSQTDEESRDFIEDSVNLIKLRYSRNGTPLRHRLCYIIDDLKVPFILTSNFDTYSISSDSELENCWDNRKRFLRIFLNQTKLLSSLPSSSFSSSSSSFSGDIVDQKNKGDDESEDGLRSKSEKIAQIKSQNKRTIFMIRGNWKKPQTMIDHLDDGEEREEKKLISECFKKYHILFIGCSISQCKKILNNVEKGTKIRQPIAFIENNERSESPPSILYPSNPSSSASMMIQYINQNQLVDYLNLVCCSADPSITKPDRSFPKHEFGVYYYTFQRSIYLHQQLAVEKVADRVSFLTPNLTNSICTPNYIDNICKKNLKEKLLDRNEMSKDQLEQTLYFMKERGLNLQYLLKNGKKIRIAFSRMSLDRTLFTKAKPFTSTSSPSRYLSSSSSISTLNSQIEGTSNNDDQLSKLHSEYTEALMGQFHANPDGFDDYNRYLLLFQLITKYPKLIELRIVNRELTNEESFALIEFEVDYDEIGVDKKKIAAAFANQATIECKASPSSVFYVCNSTSININDTSNPVKRFYNIWEESRDEKMWLHNKSVRYLHRLICKYAAERVQVEPIELKYDEGEEITSLQRSINPKIAFYRIERPNQNSTHILGKGGFGKVYFGRAYDSQSNFIMNVAIKVPKFKNRFEFNYSIESLSREADGLSRCDSSNIVKLVEFVQLLPTESHLITEFLSGESLQSLLEKYTKIGVSLLREIAIQSLNGLKTLHSSNIIHFDLSPSNLFISNFGKPEMNVKIIDLGIARVFGRDSVHPTGVGTPRYREEYSRSKAGYETDLRVLAIVLQDCLFGTDSTLDYAGDHLFDELKYPPEFPLRFFQKAFSKQYSSAFDMISDLLSFSQNINHNYFFSNFDDNRKRERDDVQSSSPSSENNHKRVKIEQ